MRNTDKNVFKIFTGAIDAWTVKKGESEKRKLRGIASGTSLDAEGDRMSESALRLMEKQIVGLTLHKDHVFNVDNTIGHFVNAKVLSSPDGDVRELWVEAELEPFDVNPDAKRIFEKIKSGTRLGFSVAGILREWERIESKDGNERFLITDIELLSVDLVTIPAYRASQGSLSAVQEGKSAGLSKSDVYVCKQIGNVIREVESEKIEIQNEADEIEDVDSRLAALELKLEELEKAVMKGVDKADSPDVDLAKLVERIERIESAVVEPPKSKGLMVLPDGVIMTQADDIEAFEKSGSGFVGL